MTEDLVAMIGAILTVFLLGTFVLLFPLSRRLGRVLEEWIKLRRETAPDRESLAGVETTLREIRQQLESHEQRLDLLADRQDFMESLAETGRRKELPSGSPGT